MSFGSLSTRMNRTRIAYQLYSRWGEVLIPNLAPKSHKKLIQDQIEVPKSPRETPEIHFKIPKPTRELLKVEHSKSDFKPCRKSPQSSYGKQFPEYRVHTNAMLADLLLQIHE